MDCSVCAETNPEGNKFCGSCGAALDASGMKLRQQIATVIEREFKDQELVAVQVADKAEERLWRWGKLLTLAFGLFVAGAGFFGVTTYNEAKLRIVDAAQVAVDGLNHAADQNRQTIAVKGAEAISQMQKAEANSVTQIQNQTRSAGNQVAAVVSRTKASNGQLQKTEDSVAALQARVAPLQSRIDILTSIRDQSPDTPIGDINGGLFTPVIQGVVGLGSVPDGTALSSASLTKLLSSFQGTQATSTILPPYKEGASGSGVTAIQNRLFSLGCYSGLATGTFDAATAAAVVAFVETNGRPSPTSLIGFIDTSPDAPAVLEEDSTPGTVDYRLWGELFALSAKKCE
jgi:hypothetical protein